MHPEVQQAEPQLGRVDLDYSEEDPADAHEDEYEKPPPEDKEHFVVDDVERKDAEGVDFVLITPRPIPVVVAGCYPREDHTHRVLGELLLLKRKPENKTSTTPLVKEHHLGIYIFLGR